MTLLTDRSLHMHAQTDKHTQDMSSAYRNKQYGVNLLGLGKQIETAALLAAVLRYT